MRGAAASASDSGSACACAFGVFREGALDESGGDISGATGFCCGVGGRSGCRLPAGDRLPVWGTLGVAGLGPTGAVRGGFSDAAADWEVETGVTGG